MAIFRVYIKYLLNCYTKRTWAVYMGKGGGKVGKTVSVIRARSSSKLAGRGGTKALSLTYPHAEKSGVLNQVIVVAELSFHHVHMVYNSTMTGRFSKQLCTNGMPSGSLNENLRTRHDF